MSNISLGTPATERITTRLNAEATDRARSKAEASARFAERQKHKNTLPAILGTAVLDLYNDIDHHNRHRRSWKSLGHLATKIMTRGRVTKKQYWESGFVDINDKVVRLYLLNGEIDARSISLPAHSSTITPDATFSHSWVLRLAPSSLSEISEGPEGELSCSIFEVTTEPKSGLKEEELKYRIEAFEGNLGADCVVSSFTDAMQDDPLITSNDGSLEHALTIIRQARKVLPL